MERLKVLFAFGVIGGCGLFGCNQGTPGGPGATAPAGDSKQAVIQQDDSFNLSAPLIATSIKQGERLATTVGIKRGKNFDEDVDIKFSDIPTGIKLDPSSATIKHGDSETKFNIEADKDAALGDFTIKVTGHPKKGADATVAYKLSVTKI